jgi:hypothetical protein
MCEEVAYEYFIALPSVFHPNDVVSVNRWIHSHLRVNLFDGYIKSLTNDATLFFNKSQHNEVLDVSSVSPTKSTMYT